MIQSKANLMLHPVRLRLILVLAAQPRSALQLARLFPDIPQATIYRHLTTLAKGGLINVIEERQVHSNWEKVYGLSKGGTRLSDHDVAQASKEDHRRYFTLFVSELLHSFDHYLAATETINLQADGVSYNLGTLYLSDQELVELQAAFRSLMLPLVANQPNAERRLRQFATVLMPAPQLPVDESNNQPDKE